MIKPSFLERLGRTLPAWDKGPKKEKKAALVALRKLGRGEVKKLLEEKASGTAMGKK